MSKITLQDIAGICGVDISTVSRALRNDPRVTASSRKSIKETAERLGYRPNLLARNLAGGRTKTLWLIMSSLDASIDYRILRHASHYANELDYFLFAALHDCDNFDPSKNPDLNHYKQLVERAGQGLADGAIITPRRCDSDVEILSDLIRRKLPVVFIDNYVEELPVPVVTTDNQAAGQELVRRCVQAGAKEVILLFREYNPVAAARLAGAIDALKELAVPFIDLHRSSEDRLPDHMADSVAILTSSQQHLHQFAVRNATQLNGRRLIFGTFDEWTGEPSPADQVIVAVQDCETMASEAVNRLIALIEKKNGNQPRITRVPILEYKTISKAF
jgi:DNA-binding LacI/PurR family transcriptional regulator